MNVKPHARTPQMEIFYRCTDLQSKFSPPIAYLKIEFKNLIKNHKARNPFDAIKC